MNLALYSGGTSNQNDLMNRSVLAQMKKFSTKKIVYITTPNEKNEYALKWLHAYFDPYMKLHFIPYFIDHENSKESITSMNNAKVILMTGGNTFYLLKHLKESGTDQILKRFVATNGLLIGFSAGSIVQTPTIQIANYPSYDCDENAVSVTDFTGLGFTKYEVHSHYSGSIQEDNELIMYSKSNNHPIYALPDGSGIFEEGAKQKIFGTIVMFDNGEKIKVACAC